ncbi:MAG: hypothetical protein OET44_19540 [Gammaproteobacteria bacterium]|nr:hypothetical protein [Gammaproteobacteria bacterium]
MSERIYCSESNESEPMAGTADVVDVWLLLEYRPAWKAKALPESDLAAPTIAWIDECIAAFAGLGLRARPQLIRQPEIDRDDVRLLVGHGDRLLQFRGRGYDFLHDLDLTALADGRLPEGAEVLDDPRYFVCTNGQRDMCCARFGLPVYQDLRERVGDRAWQVSHLGGHRFAPNVLVLPQGVLYGRVHPDLLDGFARETESGRLSMPHLRGRSYYPKHVQAAEAMSGRSDLKLLHVAGDDQAATVTFATPDGSVKVAVQRAGEPIEVLSSCANEAVDQVFPYRLG